MSEEIDVNKTSEYIIYHYWYFLDINFSFQPKVYDSCHNLMQKAISFNDIIISSVKENDYRIHFLVYE